MGSSGCKPCCSSDAKGNTIIAETPPENNDAEAAAVAMAESFEPAEPAEPEKQEDEPTKQEGTGIMAVKIVRSQDMNIGLNLDGLDGETAFVDNIIPGSVEDWNNSHDAKERLQVHDRIVKVNGIAGETDKILSELKASYAWTLVILRPMEVTVSVDCKRFPSLGLDLKYSPNGNTLLIANLGDGPIEEYNREAPQAMKIIRNDRIVAINGTRGGARKLLDCASRAESLELTILHYDT